MGRGSASGRLLDAQKSFGISRNELIPAGGPSREAVQQLMLQYKVPIEHAQQVPGVQSQSTG